FTSSVCFAGVVRSPWRRISTNMEVFSLCATNQVLASGYVTLRDVAGKALRTSSPFADMMIAFELLRMRTGTWTTPGNQMNGKQLIW
ncbi:Hypothetical predicted protein, partial [Pelobates cultripes]